MDSHFHGNDMEEVETTKKDYGNYPSDTRLYGGGIKESFMTYERVLVEN